LYRTRPSQFCKSGSDGFCDIGYVPTSSGVKLALYCPSASSTLIVCVFPLGERAYTFTLPLRTSSASNWKDGKRCASTFPPLAAPPLHLMESELSVDIINLYSADPIYRCGQMYNSAAVQHLTRSSPYFTITSTLNRYFFFNRFVLQCRYSSSINADSFFQSARSSC